MVTKEKKRAQSNFINLGLRRIRRNKNLIIVIVGGTGSGKSYTALELARCFDPEFDESRIVFRLIDFLRLVRKDFGYKGAAIVFDEGGVEMQARNFMTLMNKALSYVTQTMRFKNQIIIITVPDFSFIDVQVRKLVHVLITTKTIDYKRNLSIVRPLQISVRSSDGKTFKTYPRYYSKEKGYRKIEELAVPKPPAKLVHAYERIKLAYTEDLYKGLLHTAGGGQQVKESLSDMERSIVEAAKYGVPLDDVSAELGIATASTRGGAFPPLRSRQAVAALLGDDDSADVPSIAVSFDILADLSYNVRTEKSPRNLDR